MKSGFSLLLLLPLIVVAPVAAQAAPAKVQVTDAWCRAVPAGALSSACYLTLTAKTDDRLVSVQTSAAASAEVHSMDMSGGMMRMLC